MKRYSFDLLAGVAVQLTIGGELFLLDSAPLGGVSVEFFGAGNLKRDERIEGGMASTYARPRNGFHALSIKSDATQAVRFYVARGDMGVNVFSGSSDVTDRATRLLGRVDGTFADGWTASGQAFARALTLTAPGAGVSWHFQVKNPAASGVTVLVDKITAAAMGGASEFRAGRVDVDMATLDGQFFNRNVTGAASVAQFRRTSAAVSPLIDAFIWRVAALNVDVNLILSPPVRLPAGSGFGVTQKTQNEPVSVSFELREF